MQAGVKIRFMAELGVDFALWDGSGDTGDVEEKLGVPEDLKQRMRDWVAEYNAYIDSAVPGSPLWTEDRLLDFDRRGYQMSVELQRLSNAYEVEYSFMTAEIQRCAWAERVEPDRTRRCT